MSRATDEAIALMEPFIVQQTRAMLAAYALQALIRRSEFPGEKATQKAIAINAAALADATMRELGIGQ